MTNETRERVRTTPTPLVNLDLADTPSLYFSSNLKMPSSLPSVPTLRPSSLSLACAGGI